MGSKKLEENREAVSTFEEDIEFFKSRNKELSTEHGGKFVLIKNQRTIGIFSNFEDAHKEALKRFGNEDVVIAQIGVDVPLNYIASVV
ncbi:MAG: hypothetical protein HWN68_17805 [Desulfobacterales bacterium]|nr:hypothetical protein [Desulfobacterales bacterium]